jgi:hypothetical protein
MNFFLPERDFTGLETQDFFACSVCLFKGDREKNPVCQKYLSFAGK